MLIDEETGKPYKAAHKKFAQGLFNFIAKAAGYINLGGAVLEAFLGHYSKATFFLVLAIWILKDDN